MRRVLFKSSIALITLIFIGKFSGFIKDVLISYFFGVGPETDALFLAVYISSLVYIAIYSSISLVIIPKCIDVLKRKCKVEELFSCYILYILISLLVSFGTYYFAEILVDLLSSSREPSVVENAAGYLQLMALTFPLSTMVAILNSLQSVKKNIILVYITPVLNNVIFCLTTVVFHSELDFYYILIAGLISWFLIFLLNFNCEKPNIKKIYWRFYKVRWSDFKIHLLGFSSLFVFLEQIVSFIPVYYGSIGEIGDISTYTLATKLNWLVLSVTLMLITTHILPKLALCNDEKALRKMLSLIFDLLCMGTLPLVVICYINSFDIVEIVFHRGNFSLDNVNDVSSIFSIVIFSLPIAIYKDVLNRAFFTMGKSKACVMITSVIVLVNIISSYFIYPLLGMTGVAICFSISCYIHVGILQYFLFDNGRLAISMSVFCVFIKRCVIAVFPALVLSYWDINIIFYVLFYIFIYLFCLFLTMDKRLFRLIRKNSA